MKAQDVVYRSGKRANPSAQVGNPLIASLFVMLNQSGKKFQAR